MTTPPSPAPASTGTWAALADTAAGVATAALVVLLGAPAGLLWSLVAPHVQVTLADSGPSFDVETHAFIGADGVYLLIAVLLGLASGTVAWVLGRRHGVGVVLGLTVGGLLAAFVASRVGQELGREAFRAAVEDPARRGVVEASVRLRAWQAMALWPVGALAAFGGLTALRTSADEPGPEAPVDPLWAAPAASLGPVSSG